ncbi:MAG: AraC family transcriptional regulator [Bacteroidia bacterium]|nr:MAG: AraC family transcriptional regulator [Bacteroidia bacterium]
MGRIMREVTPVTSEDLFVVLNHYNAKFDFPVHFHPEYELNLVLNSKGKRIIGDSILDYGSPDLVLIGPNTPHAWTGNTDNSNAQVVTVQFDGSFFSEKMLSKKFATPIRELFEKSVRGILFPVEAIDSLKGRLIKLSEMHGFDSFMGFLSILYDLSISRNQMLLASQGYVGQFDANNSERISKVIAYLQENLINDLKIKHVADLVNMSETAFSHFFKKRTQRSFSDYLTDMRISYAARLILETDRNISEICFISGFNNLSNFNRTFRGRYNCTPGELRSQQQFLTRH